MANRNNHYEAAFEAYLRLGKSLMWQWTKPGAVR